MWEIRPDGSLRQVADLANDDVIGGFTTGESALVVAARESRPDDGLVTVSFADGDLAPTDLPPDSVPLGWSLPQLFAVLRGGE